MTSLYSGNPATRSASPSFAASTGAQSTPANWLDDAEGRLQFEHAGGGGFGFVEAAERDQRADQDHIIDAVGGIRLDGLPGGLCCFCGLPNR